jgi:tRNA dimethylallyltransferase
LTAARHLALVGGTASGKSELAVEVALALGGPPVEIVTVDSMQIYRGMDLGTAKPTLGERAGVPHHLIDLADPAEEWDVTRWVCAARQVIAGIEARGRRALLVGGTGLYFQALIDGLEPPGRWPQVAATLAQELDSEASTVARLHQRLSRLDPVAASRIDPGNRRRVLRALEVTVGSGRPFSSFGPGLDIFPPTGWRLAGVWLPRAVVRARVEARFAAMMAAGLLEEVKALADRPLSRTARQALGYRELLAHLEGGMALDRAVAEAVQRTQQFARRQRMWWRRDPRVRWFGVADNPLAVLPALLGNWEQP